MAGYGPMRILFATSNPYKLEEVRAICQPLLLDVMGLDALGVAPDEPTEDGDTFEANARLKAVGYARATGYSCLADDSGLAVDALDGAPGVHSARYAALAEHRPSVSGCGSAEGGFQGSVGPSVRSRAERDAANNQRLLRELARIPWGQRTARFVCAMCLARADGTIEAESHGTCEGIIAELPRGAHGFGYDPLLVLPECGLTLAELLPGQKNAHSHRGAAARAMVELLCQRRLAG
ncbi:non-canonical purine NTP pyrophosphatase [Myxococcota bacterium]